MKPVLVACLSPSGSTRQICEHLKTSLEASGFPVNLVDLADRPDPRDSLGAVVAAPIHGMQWMPEAVAWVEAHREALKGRPVALVAVSYLYFEGRRGWHNAISRHLEGVRKGVPHASVQVFGGRLPSALPTPARWLFGVKKGRPLDLVDPAAVAQWVSSWTPTLRMALRTP